MRTYAVGALGLTMLALSACGGGGGSAAAPVPMDTATATAVAGSDGVQQVTLEGTDQLMFVPMAMTAKVGMLRVTFKNVGSIAHTFRINGLEPDTGNVNGHSQVSVMIDLTKPGTYTYSCDYHPTMVGTLVVSP